MLGGIRRWLFLKALAGVKRNKTPKPPLHHNPMSEIFILYEIATISDYEIVQSWADRLRKSGKKIHTLCFVKNPSIKPANDESVYTAKEVGYNYVPKGGQIDDFINAHGYVLVVLCHDFHHHMRYITFAHDSYFKIGLKFPNSETYFHMTVDTDNEAAYNQVIQHIVQSINKLSNT